VLILIAAALIGFDPPAWAGYGSPRPLYVPIPGMAPASPDQRAILDRVAWLEARVAQLEAQVARPPSPPPFHAPAPRLRPLASPQQPPPLPAPAPSPAPPDFNGFPIDAGPPTPPR
jgi:hypothetical protein